MRINLFRFPLALIDIIDILTLTTGIIMDDKQKALQLAIGQIEKDHGKGALMKLGGEQLIQILRLYLLVL